MSRAALLLVTGAALSSGCAHLQRTDRLDEARAAYEKAQQGPAAESSPADLATAKKFLELAEKGLDTGDPKVVDDRATVAILKVQSAEALGRTHELAAERDRTLQSVTATRQTLLDQAQQKLALTRAELEREKAARDATDTRTTQSRAVLAQEALIRDLPEGTVISLPGGQLFRQGQAELLPSGRDRDPGRRLPQDLRPLGSGPGTASEAWLPEGSRGPVRPARRTGPGLPRGRGRHRRPDQR